MSGENVTGQGEKNGGASRDADAAIPEVEAEIVEPSEPKSDYIENEETAVAGESAADAQTSPKARALTPGLVLFIVFAVLALGAFGYWMWQGRSAAPAAAETAASTGDGAAGAAAGAIELTAPTLARPPAANGQPGPDAADKIENASIAAIEAPSPADEAGEAERSLGDPDRIASAASDQADPGEAGSPQPDAPEAAAIEKNAIDEEIATATAQLSAGQAADDAPLGDAGIAPEVEKLTNDAGELKPDENVEMRRLAAALALEQEKTAALEAEMLAMRERYENALRLRDEEAAQRLASLRLEAEALRREAQARAGLGSGAAAEALAALTAAVHAGGAYEAELDALARYSADAPALSALRVSAATGVATRQELTKAFREAARKALAAAGQGEAEGVFDNLSARAKSLISVRPAYPQAGDAPAAIISRIEDAVERGAFETALIQLDLLPPPAQAELSVWAGSARAHAEVSAALVALNSALLTQAAR